MEAPGKHSGGTGETWAASRTVAVSLDALCSAVPSWASPRTCATMPVPMPPTAPIDLGALGAFLMSDRAPENSMGLSDVDGFLTGVVVGPELIMPSEWTRVVWGGEGPLTARRGPHHRVRSGDNAEATPRAVPNCGRGGPPCAVVTSR